MKDFSPINVSTWLESQITQTMKKIEQNREDDDLLSILDKYISMKKKYEGAIDTLGETIRVMEEFSHHSQQFFPKKSSFIKEIVQHFLNSK